MSRLSSKQRKKLKASTFCGPDRSFPVPDCDHVTAARRMIGRYKGGGSKEKIMACVEKKAQKMSCETGKDDSPVTFVDNDSDIDVKEMKKANRTEDRAARKEARGEKREMKKAHKEYKKEAKSDAKETVSEAKQVRRAAKKEQRLDKRIKKKMARGAKKITGNNVASLKKNIRRKIG